MSVSLVKKVYPETHQISIVGRLIKVTSDVYQVDHVNSIGINNTAAQAGLGCGIFLIIPGIVIVMVLSAKFGFVCIFLGVIVILALWGRRSVEWQMSSGQLVEARFASKEKAEACLRQIQQAMEFKHQPTVSFSDELVKLYELKELGVLSEEDLAKVKDDYLQITDRERERTIKALKSLFELCQAGVLSQSEFNMKKWEILSRKKPL